MMIRVFILLLGLCSLLFAEGTPPGDAAKSEVKNQKSEGKAAETPPNPPAHRGGEAEVPSLAQMQTPEVKSETPPDPPSTGRSRLESRGDNTEDVPWLHVEVETKYTWISQTSIARCWTTKSRDDTTRVNVGQLCLLLDAHWTHKTCETDTCYLEIKEVRRRLAVPKATATVTAWSENPHIEQTSVKMAP
jgi:hypothetical protein